MQARSALVAAIIALTTLTLATPPAQAATSAGSYSAAAFGATNHQRDKHDRVQLRRGDCLRGFARRQARRMARQERIFHQDLRPVLRRCHMRLVGENVAMGFPTGTAVVNRGWMKSPGHRANILDRRYRRMAIVARRGDDGSWYVSQLFGRHG